MKILVTGSSGYIGSVLCPMLMRAGHEVFPFDIKHGRDICNLYDLQIVESVDAIIHLAACSTPAICDENPTLAHLVNVTAVRILNELRGNKPMIYPNTNIGYGAMVKQGIYDEESVMTPYSVYGKTKCEAERLILEHGHCVVFRLASLFGHSPCMSWKLLLNFMVKEAFDKGALQIYEGGARRNFLHVRDVCTAFLYAIDHYELMKNQVYNVGVNFHPTKLQLAGMIADALPSTMIEQIDGSDQDHRDYIVSSDKLLSAGWKPEFSIKSGIEELIGVLRG